MPASEDDAGIPRVITARTPGYVPPKEYVQFLDMGGELAKLSSLTDDCSTTAVASIRILSV